MTARRDNAHVPTSGPSAAGDRKATLHRNDPKTRQAIDAIEESNDRIIADLRQAVATQNRVILWAAISNSIAVGSLVYAGTRLG